jgi:ABC-type bacteriocin/lantibiotic exporter with double-glycine peptidase domain
MVMGYWGREVDAGRVYAELGSGAGGGVELAAMKKYLEGAGFQAFTLRGAWVDLENHLSKRRPLIVALRPGERKRLHFAVVTGVEGERVWLNDPTRSKPAAVGRREFEKQWEQGGRWLMVAAPTRIP